MISDEEMKAIEARRNKLWLEGADTATADDLLAVNAVLVDADRLFAEVKALRHALLRLANTWDRLGPPLTATISGRPTAIQEARVALGDAPP